MQTDRFNSVRQRLEGYKSEVEQWKCDHDLAIGCMDFELMLQHGLSIYQAINWIDEELRSRVYTKKDQHDPDTDQVVSTLYHWWLSPCDRVLEELRKHEEHFTVSYADEFHAACREVRGILADDADFFSGGDLVTIRDQAIDAHRRGECESCQE